MYLFHEVVYNQCRFLSRGLQNESMTPARCLTWRTTIMDMSFIINRKQKGENEHEHT